MGVFFGCWLYLRDIPESPICGRPAADKFCSTKGFSHAFFFSSPTPLSQTNPSTGILLPSIDNSLRVDGVCNDIEIQEKYQTNCQTFSSITCCGDSGASVAYAHPSTCADLIDWVDALGDRYNDFTIF
jgi:uncharacterized protein CbrC (UPF0167 family)